MTVSLAAISSYYNIILVRKKQKLRSTQCWLSTQGCNNLLLSATLILVYRVSIENYMENKWISSSKLEIFCAYSFLCLWAASKRLLKITSFLSEDCSSNTNIKKYSPNTLKSYISAYLSKNNSGKDDGNVIRSVQALGIRTLFSIWMLLFTIILI